MGVLRPDRGHSPLLAGSDRNQAGNLANQAGDNRAAQPERTLGKDLAFVVGGVGD